MADNNLVLTIVLVVAALLLFNGGLSGNAIYGQSCSQDGDTFCKGGNQIWKCENGVLIQQTTCGLKQECYQMQQGGYTTGPKTAFCLTTQQSRATGGFA